MTIISTNLSLRFNNFYATVMFLYQQQLNVLKPRHPCTSGWHQCYPRKLAQRTSSLHHNELGKIFIWQLYKSILKKQCTHIPQARERERETYNFHNFLKLIFRYFILLNQINEFCYHRIFFSLWGLRCQQCLTMEV